MIASRYIDQLRALRLSHATFEATYRRAYTQVALSSPSQLIVVAGPTRVGKTTLGRRLTAELIDSSHHEDGTIPLIREEAATTNQGKFSTKHFTLRLLEQLSDPITSIGAGTALRRSQSETHLRLHLERCLKYRKTRYLVVDEAQHLLRTTGHLRPGEVIDTLKCLANVTDLTIVLIGGYELLQTCIQSSHLNGRLTIVDFPPYGDDEQSINEFDRILLSLEQHIPSKQGFLHEHHERLYRGSLGCVGLLVEWTIKALAEMQVCSNRELQLKHFTATRYAIQNQPIADEIALGASLLGWKFPVFSTASPAKPQISSTKRGRRVGVRNPHRDPGPTSSCR